MLTGHSWRLWNLLVHMARLPLQSYPTALPPLNPPCRTLRLDNNKLSGLPEGLLTLTSLTHLSLRHNNFSNLPYRFGDLHCLKKLDLGENMLKTLPPTMVRVFGM